MSSGVQITNPEMLDELYKEILGWEKGELAKTIINLYIRISGIGQVLELPDWEPKEEEGEDNSDAA